MATPRRHQRNMARIREDIVEAAARAFNRHGHRRVTMQDIAREAGYTAASLYTYFRGKEEIAEELLRMTRAEYVRTFAEPMPAGLTFDQKLQLIVVRHLELVDRRRPFFSVVFNVQAGGMGDACRRTSFHKTFEDRIRVLADWLRQNATPEDIGGHDPDLVARFFIGFGFGLFQRWMSAPAKERLVDRAPLVLDFFFNGVRGGSQASRKGST
jgi:AcrR family transcriptional regulator